MYPKLADDRERLPALLATVSAYAAGGWSVWMPHRWRFRRTNTLATSFSPSGIGAEGALQRFRTRWRHLSPPAQGHAIWDLSPAGRRRPRCSATG